MAAERLSFRWGIPWLDAGFVQVPNFFFERYLQVGLSRPEFLFLLHLARYKFDSERGVARPSLTKVAKEMGYGKRQVQRIVKSLEDKGWLVVTERPGKASEYNFEALARALLRADEKHDRNVTRDTNVTGRGDTHVTGRGDTHVTRRIRREEEESEEDLSSSDIHVEVDKQALARLLVMGYGQDISGPMVERYGGKRVLAVIEEALQGDHLGGPGDWIRRELARCPDHDSQLTEGGDDDRGTAAAA